MAHERDIDAVTGTATTGHEWDGIRELNTPLPRWWLWLFYLTIVWSIGYWIAYPSWPLISSYTVGLLNWHSREAIIADMDALKQQRGPMVERLLKSSLAEIAADENLSQFARAQGRPVFLENCAPCHGTGGGGARGYPNLLDDEWLWGGRLDDIALTIRDGIRTPQSKERQGSMPAFSHGHESGSDRDSQLVQDRHVGSSSASTNTSGNFSNEAMKSPTRGRYLSCPAQSGRANARRRCCRVRERRPCGCNAHLDREGAPSPRCRPPAAAEQESLS